MSRFSYTEVPGPSGQAGMLPFVSLTLDYVDEEQLQVKRVEITALVDSGATVSVLPRDIGERFGLNWYEQQHMFDFAGTIYGHPTLALPLFATISGQPPKHLWFAWSELSSNKIRTLLGQTNFFDEFYVDFRKPLGYFEIALKDE
jgi:hypothetical protein